MVSEGVPNIQRKLMLNFVASLSDRKCSEQYIENLYCHAGELAFLVSDNSLSMISPGMGDRYTLH